MEKNIYDAPKADLGKDDRIADHEFYVVSTQKFTILFLATFGIYSVFWFYRNWKMYKNYHDDDISPIARGIFSIFFAHSLFEYVDLAIERKSQKYNWSPSLYATLYVLFAIGGRIADKLSESSIGSPLTDIISILLIFTTCFVLARVQVAINFSQDDEQAQTNSRLTLANYLWCVPGLAIWVLALLGLAVAFGVIKA